MKLKTHIFHNTAKAAADGAFFDNSTGEYKSLTVDIDGTTTSHTVEFKAQGPNKVVRTIRGLRVSDWVDAASTTGTAETWQFDITGLRYIYMDISAMVVGAGSGLNIKGTATR